MPTPVQIDYTKIKPNMARLEQVNKQLAELVRERDELVAWLQLHEKSLSDELEKLCATLHNKEGVTTLLSPPK
jgi:hypothetical protein